MTLCLPKAFLTFHKWLNGTEKWIINFSEQKRNYMPRRLYCITGWGDLGQANHRMPQYLLAACDTTQTPCQSSASLWTVAPCLPLWINRQTIISRIHYSNATLMGPNKVLPSFVWDDWGVDNWYTIPQGAQHLQCRGLIWGYFLLIRETQT